MPYKLLIFISIFWAMSLNAQNKKQNGVVRLINSGKKPLPNVTVQFNDAPPTTSDENGKFTLAFQNTVAGQVITPSNVGKVGYELVNARTLFSLKLGNTANPPLVILMAKQGEIAQARMEYYNISLEAVTTGYRERVQKLQNELNQEKINTQEFQEKYSKLTEQLETQEARLNDLADKFARTNFDDVSDLYKEAFELFKAGDIEGAIAKLEEVDLMGRVDERIKEREKIKELIERKVENEQGIKENIEALKLSIELYALNYEIEKAAEVYEKLLLLDENDFEIITYAANFYRENHFYERAFDLYSKIISQPQAEDWQIANAYGFLGSLYTETGNLAQALENFLKFNEFCKKAYQYVPENTFYKENLAISYSKLGDIHSSLGNLDKALTFFEEDIKLTTELYEQYPKNANFKNGLAISYYKLGDTYTNLGNLEKALTFFENHNRLVKELYEQFPENVNFKNNLAISYEKLGDAHSNLGNLEKALIFLKNAID